MNLKSETMINQVDTELYERLKAKFDLVLMQCTQPEMRELRSNAYEIFQENGFPTIKNEEWRFTNLQPFLKDNYELEIVPHAISTEESGAVAHLIASHTEAIQQSLKGEQKGAYRLVLMNGVMSPQHSFLPDESMLRILPFEAAKDTEGFKKYFGKIASLKDNGLAALNTAMFSDGIYVEASRNAVLDKPLHIIHVLITGNNVWVQPRSLFVIQEHAAVEVIETVITDNRDRAIFVNAVSEAALETGAHFHHYDIQTGRMASRFVKRMEVRQATHSNYSNYTFSFPGADLIRNNLTLHLNDKDLESHLYGLYLSADKQLVDNHTEVHHKFPNGESNQLYKGILLDESKAVFNGKIYVYEDAQKTNAFQQSNNLLFSDKATVNAKPQLEIFADDVKCSHGTTIGQMDKEALFYLQSRGIGAQSARTLMMAAFAFDVTEKVKNPTLRSYLEKEIRKIMAGA